MIAGSIEVPASCGSSTQTWYFTVRKLGKPMSADDGAPDISFGLGSARLPGTALARVGGCNGTNGASAVVVDSDGYITAAGIASDDTLNRSVIGLARWDSDGKADLNFNTDGATTFDVPDTDYSSGKAIAVNSRGQLIVAGNASSSTGNVGAILRFEKNGNLDTTFGGGRLSKGGARPEWSVVLYRRGQIRSDSSRRSIQQPERRSKQDVVPPFPRQRQRRSILRN